MARHIHVAWNSPLAWVRAERLARAMGQPLRILAMRDTDRDLASIVLVRDDSDIRDVGGLRGKTVGVGAIDSPQATLLPIAYLDAQGLRAGTDFSVRRFDVLGGKHGDHVGGEREAVLALSRGEVDAACVIEGNLAVFERDGSLTPGSTRILARTNGYDHCNLTAGPSARADLVERFRRELLAMSYDDPEVRPLFDLEGLTHWCDGRTEGYRALADAVDLAGFYDQAGALTAKAYRY
jgi:ABC-type phosphate/phosphonate transport system substrate-binding protein